MIGLSYSITPNRNAPFSNDLKIPDFFCPELSSKGNLALEGFTFHICASSGAKANVFAEFELTQLDSHQSEQGDALCRRQPRAFPPFHCTGCSIRKVLGATDEGIVTCNTI